jgi:hypothetical protein
VAAGHLVTDFKLLLGGDVNLDLLDGAVASVITGFNTGDLAFAVAFEGGTLHVLTCAHDPSSGRPGGDGNEAKAAAEGQELLRGLERDPEYQALRKEDPDCFRENLFVTSAMPEERRMDCLRRHGPAIAGIVMRVEQAHAQAPTAPPGPKPADPLCGRARLRVGEAGALEGTFEGGEFGPDWTAVGPAGAETRAKGSWRYAGR